MLFTDVLRKGQQHSSELFLSRPAVMKSRSRKSYVRAAQHSFRSSVPGYNVPPGATEKIFAQTLFSYSFLPYYNSNFCVFQISIFQYIAVWERVMPCWSVWPKLSILLFFFVPRVLFQFISGAQYIICVADKMGNRKKHKKKNK